LEEYMNKGRLIILSILGIIAFLIWASCNPFQQQDKSSNLSSLDGTDSVRASAGATVLYVAPGGTAGAAGDINNPTTIDEAILKIASGGTIYVRGGTYNYTATVLIAEGNNGASGSLKKVWAYNSEVPVFDFANQSYDSQSRGFVVAGNYWHFIGITIQKAGDNGMLLAGHYNTIEACKFLGNRDPGLQLSRYNTSYSSISQWPHNNTITNCTAKDNYDPDNGEDADGFAPKLTCGSGNTFTGCKALYNCDDGWDCYTKTDTGAIGVIVIDSCEASNNGKTSSGQTSSGSDGNGFKLGGESISVKHTIKNSTANNNKKCGFTGNSNPGPITVTNCTGTGNGQSLFDRL
jgi:hypothetical protein